MYHTQPAFNDQFKQAASRVEFLRQMLDPSGPNVQQQQNKGSGGGIFVCGEKGGHGE